MSLPDLPELADPRRTRQRQLVLLAVSVLVIGVGIGAYLYFSDPGRGVARDAETGRRVVTQDFATPARVQDPQENWITQSERELKAQESRNRDQDRELTRLKEELERLRGERSSSRNGLLPLPRPADAGATDNSAFDDLPAPALPPLPPRPTADSPSPAMAGAAAGAGASPAARTARIVGVQFASLAPGEVARPHIRDTLPAGSFARGVLLNGLAAPTGNLGEKNPHPVLLELIDVGNLPNRFAHRIEQCRVIAAGYGELSDERAYLRLERLSCVLTNGEVVSKALKGYVAGEDGKNGLVGMLITKQGALVGRALLAGIFSGLGRAISQTYQTVSTSALGTVQNVDPDDIYAVGASEGIATAAEKVADWYLKRADEVFPFVEIEAGRIVTVTLTEDVELGADLFAEGSVS